MEVSQDTVLGDVRLPRGTLLWCILRHDSLDERLFDNAQAFRPERWLAKDGEPSTTPKGVSLPFGAGPRTCPGRYLALLEIKLALAALLNRFDLAEVYSTEGDGVREHMAFVMSPASLRMRLVHRAEPQP
jgi:cytochrome P450